MISFWCLPSHAHTQSVLNLNVSMYWCHRIRAFAVNHNAGCVCGPTSLHFETLLSLCRRPLMMYFFRVFAFVVYTERGCVCALIAPCVRVDHRMYYIIAYIGVCSIFSFFSSFFFRLFAHSFVFASLSTFQTSATQSTLRVHTKQLFTFASVLKISISDARVCAYVRCGCVCDIKCPLDWNGTLYLHKCCVQHI